MTFRPLEYVVVGVTDANSHLQLMRALLAELTAIQEKNHIHVIDFVVVKKTKNEKVKLLEAYEVDASSVRESSTVTKHLKSLLSEQAVSEIASRLSAGSAASVMVYEHVSTTPPVPAPAQVSSPIAAPSSANNALLVQLKLLGELHTSGVLTDEEFVQQKQRILN